MTPEPRVTSPVSRAHVEGALRELQLVLELAELHVLRVLREDLQLPLQVPQHPPLLVQLLLKRRDAPVPACDLSKQRLQRVS